MHEGSLLRACGPVLVATTRYHTLRQGAELRERDSRFLIMMTYETPAAAAAAVAAIQALRCSSSVIASCKDSFASTASLMRVRKSGS